MKFWAFTTLSLLLSIIQGGWAVQCGLCCSEFGWCGNTIAYCGKVCQSQCGGGGGGDGSGIGDLLSSSTLNEMLKHRNNGACLAQGFYTYDAFIAATEAFPTFGTTGDNETRKREIAAFLAQTSHETTIS